MNQIVYKDDISNRLKNYLFVHKKPLKEKKIINDYQKYRKGSLYYLVKLNCFIQNSKKTKTGKISFILFDFLDKNLDKILIGDVNTLLKINNDFKVLFPNQIPEQIIEYYDKELLTKPISIKLSDLLKNHLFVFKNLDTDDRKQLILSIKNKLCPYCSRNFINLIKGVTHNMGVNLDHFYSQKDFPMFGISFYNLIPCCQTCNSAFKGGNDLDDSYIHPSTDSLNSVRYTLKLNNKKGEFKAEYFLSHKSFEIDYVENFGEGFSQKDFDKFKKSAEFFKIKQTYNAHKEVVQRSLIDYYVYEEGELLDSIQKTFPRLNLKHKALGTGINKDDWFYLPFGKLKYDILSKLVSNKATITSDYHKLFYEL